MKARWLWLPLAAWFAASVAGGCQSIAGIEDREYSEDYGQGGGSSGSGPVSGGSTAQGGLNGSAGEGSMTPCEEYCSLAATACSNECAAGEVCNQDFSLYISTGACMQLCVTWEVGDLEERDPTGNTLACRLKQVRDADQLQNDKIEHCASAGPGGNGVCGEDCDNYCNMMRQFCTGDNEVFVDPDCETHCLGILPAKRTDADRTASLFGAERLHHDSDSRQCRIVHAASAALAADTHCWHANLAPLKNPTTGLESPCLGTPADVTCESYCEVLGVSCTDELAQFQSKPQCLAVCKALPTGEGGNTLACRKTHAYNALGIGTVPHCYRAGPSGDGVCGSNCESYCALLEKGCPDDFTDVDECLSECQQLPGAAANSKFTLESVEPGDNYGCRLLALLKVLDGDNDLCVDATGGGECAD